MSDDRPIPLLILVPIGGLLGFIGFTLPGLLAVSLWGLPPWTAGLVGGLGLVAGGWWAIKRQADTRMAPPPGEPFSLRALLDEEGSALADDTWREAERKLRIDELREEGHRPGQLGVVDGDGAGGLALADQAPEDGSR